MRDYDQYLRELRQQGYITTRSLRTHHFKIYDRHGCLVAVCSGTTGDRRSLANLKGDIRRHVCPMASLQRQPGTGTRSAAPSSG
jgi:hypothetical protein